MSKFIIIIFIYFIYYIFLGPNPCSNIAPLVDSTNVTLEFPRPEGRIEYYVINWEALDGNERMEPKYFTFTIFICYN